MDSLATVALIGQTLVSIFGGGAAVAVYFKRRGASEEKLNRIIKQVEPNAGTSLRDDVTLLTDEFRRFANTVDQRLKRLENV